MSKQKVDVIVDVHETDPSVAAAVVSHPEVENYTLDQELPAADLEIEGIGFERKTVSDYVGSMKGKRLDSQTRKMNQRYEVAYILVDGDMAETRNVFKTDMDGNSIRGSWASLTARDDSGIRAVIPCSNNELLVDMAIRLTRKHIEDSDREFIPMEPTEPNAPTAKKMYAQIPGVGPKMAGTLYDKYPAVIDLIREASHESLQQIEGVGPTTASKIMDAFE